jgi:hypothetical protein
MKKDGKRHEVPCHPILEEYLNPDNEFSGRDSRG